MDKDRVRIDRFTEQDIHRVLDDLDLVRRYSLTHVQQFLINRAFDRLESLVIHDPTRAKRVDKMVLDLLPIINQ